MKYSNMPSKSRFVWFYSRIETAAERPTHALNAEKNLHRAPPERLRRAFCFLTQTYHRCRVTGLVSDLPRLPRLDCHIFIYSSPTWPNARPRCEWFLRVLSRTVFPLLRSQG